MSVTVKAAIAKINELHASGAAVSPTAILDVIALVEKMEPTVQALLMPIVNAALPGNPIVAGVTALFPILLQILNAIEAAYTPATPAA